MPGATEMPDSTDGSQTPPADHGLTAEQETTWFAYMRVALRLNYEVNRELQRIQGELAVDFHLRRGEPRDDAALAREIDGYCLETPDATGLSWQVCASSLLWFVVAGAPQEPK